MIESLWDHYVNPKTTENQEHIQTGIVYKILANHHQQYPSEGGLGILHQMLQSPEDNFLRKSHLLLACVPKIQ